jgi:alginate O-acetyltransferase complex protein AlgI
MTFDSLTFAVFLAIVFPIYALTSSWSARKNILLVASCVFYGAWNPFFLLLLAFTTVFDWWAGKRIRAATSDAARKRWLVASIIASVAILSYFKYAQFFANTAILWFGWVGIRYAPIDLGIVLPLGISFYIFESISYIVDVYKKRIEPTKDLRDYALFMTFFPHLVAGPIMRYADFGAQTRAPRTVTGDGVSLGASLLVAGLFLKIVCADYLFAPVADAAFMPTLVIGASQAWLGAAAFSMQLFCDFAGYSLAAVGVARMFGFVLPTNFESPFASVGFAELWTRWHISLSNWMRDYVYAPLGGNRFGHAKAARNVLITFLVSGAWHGAAWHFVIWGLLHGIFIASERWLASSVGHWMLWRHSFVRALLALLTFTLFTFAVVFFRAPDVSLAWLRVQSMLGISLPNAQAWNPSSDTWLCIAAIAIALAVQGILKSRKGWQWMPALAWPARAALLAFMMLAIILSPGKTAAFIYFQF